MSVVKGMVEQRRLAHHARCRVKSWRLTELQAWMLADEIRWVHSGFKESAMPSSEIVQAMKRGEIQVLGAKVCVQ